MATLLSKPFHYYNARSVSLQPRSHPSMLRIEEELNKIRAWEASSSSSHTASICIQGLSLLADLYRCIEELLKLPQTEQALSQKNQNQLWVNELLDSSLRYLEICSTTKDAVLLMKESLRELRSALRRSRGGELSIESDVTSFYASRKKLKKEITKSLTALKQIDKKFGTFPLLNLDHHTSALVRALSEASLCTGSIFHSLLAYLCVPVVTRPKTNRWFLVSKLVHKGAVASQGENTSMTELESVDTALGNLLIDNSNKDSEVGKIQSAYERLEALDVSFEDLENGLECLFRHLIHARVSLLNALSYYHG